MTTDQATDPDAALAAAEREAAEARELLAALEARHAAGDDQVTVEQLTEHNELAYLARLRLEAAQRDAERARIAGETERRDRAAAKVREMLAPHARPRLAERVTAARDALLALVDAIEARNQAIAVATSQLVGGGWPQAASPQQRDATIAGSVPSWLRLDGEQYDAHSPGEMVLGVVHLVARARGGIQAQRAASVARVVDGKLASGTVDTVAALAGE